MPCDSDCVYFWNWYYMWTIRSTILKAGSILLILAFLLDVGALVSNFWLEGKDGHTGLFDVTIDITKDIAMPIPVLCPILGVLSAIILFCNNILNLLFVTRKFHLAMPAVIVFAFIGALMLMTVIVTWSVPDVTMGRNLSWSFFVATVAVVVDMAGCGLCVMEFLSRRDAVRMSLPQRDVEAAQQLQELESDSDDRGGGGGGGEDIEMQDL